MIDGSFRERSRLRQAMVAQRDRLSAEERLAKSERIAAVLMTHPLFSQKKLVFIYCHFRSEVQTARVIDECLERGKTVCVPMSLPEQAQMAAVAIIDPLCDLAPGYMGIPEPLPLLTQTRRVEPAAIEVAVIPGTVFDRSGHRLGYGLGFYDRFLVRAPTAIRIGLSFACQMVERLPAQPHDIPMDMIVTEEEVMVWPGRLRARVLGL
ncbi:5-formyltetrahydrofolate cyclo-ligase [Desulfobulbus elongatus]|uniref:5-formyltetrahydrofolate cyclo-ligase n=1 Tax=Desulfobulbus elongatus TaxID=53332 RepID=UPI0006842E8F|nr:5-formyltetrahydrofolate cyclo-ligase [Desulfobulbus elongatus]